MRRSQQLAVAVAVVALCAGGAALAADDPSGADDHRGQRGEHHRGDGRGGAVVALRDAAGDRVGKVTISSRRGRTLVRVRIDRLPDGFATMDFHGMHFHANDEPANGDGCIADPAQPSATWFVSADGHFTGGPGRVHGDHAGDIPSPYVREDGTARVDFVTDAYRARDLIGTALILHAGRDNFRNVPVGAAPDQYTPNSPAATAKTDATGNAGDRIACGVVQRAD